MEVKINVVNWIIFVIFVIGGFIVVFNDGSSYIIINGKDGEVGVVGIEWIILEDGFWVCNGEKIIVKVVG